jgi:hypothetical protein
MEDVSNRINKMFQTLFKEEIHPFFTDLRKVYKTAQTYRDHMIQYIKHDIEYKPITTVPDGIKIEPKYKVLGEDMLHKLDKEISNVMNYNKILKIVSFMSQYILQSNIMNPDELYKRICKEDTINIMIIGGGPAGLFLACYLHLYYNETKMNSSPRVNVVMYDNRIDKPGFRKPYNRQRLFSTASNYLNLIIPKLYCWSEKEQKDYIMVNIFMLEYILYMIATTHYKIPMIYDNYSWDDYINIIDKGKFDVVFDCTGGRLNHDIINITDMDMKWLNNINLYDSIIKRKLDVNKEMNLVLLNNDSNHIVNYFYGSLTLHHNDESLTFQDKFDFDVMDKEDLMYLNKMKGTYFNYKTALHLIQGIKDDNTRNFLYTIMQNKNDEHIFTFDVWGIYIRHAIKISEVFKVKNRDVLMVGMGDTIFHSHFITGAGLNRIFDFSVKCANLLTNLRE